MDLFGLICLITGAIMLLQTIFFNANIIMALVFEKNIEASNI